MKSLNNKGFAISTVIYGLSIMSIMIMVIIINTMASTRANTKELSKSIEKELNDFSRTEINFKASANSQKYTIPDEQDGWYRIELWGAGYPNGGYGAYTSGIIELKAGDTIIFNHNNESYSSTIIDVRPNEVYVNYRRDHIWISTDVIKKKLE